MAPLKCSVFNRSDNLHQKWFALRLLHQSDSKVRSQGGAGRRDSPNMSGFRVQVHEIKSWLSRSHSKLRGGGPTGTPWSAAVCKAGSGAASSGPGMEVRVYFGLS